VIDHDCPLNLAPGAVRGKVTVIGPRFVIDGSRRSTVRRSRVATSTGVLFGSVLSVVLAAILAVAAAAVADPLADAVFERIAERLALMKPVAA
jgi:hypothetical protein